MPSRKMLISPTGRRYAISRAPMMGFDSIGHIHVMARRMIMDMIQFLRAQKIVTRHLGYQFSRSRTLMEIDVTYRCDMKCPNCNRSCTQAPDRLDMPAAMIESFIRQSVENEFLWKRIRILGGEPALHPEITVILDLMLQYKRRHNPSLRIVLCTHRHRTRMAGILDRIPEGIEIRSSFKTSSFPWFRPFNMAPADSILFSGSDFRSGCRIIRECGMGLTPSGYYPCAISGGIDRIFGFNLGRKKLPEASDSMRDQMDVLCRLCGHFGLFMPTKRKRISSIWEKAYRKYLSEKPQIIVT